MKVEFRVCSVLVCSYHQFIAGVFFEELAQTEFSGNAAEQFAGCKKSILDGVVIVCPSGYRLFSGMESRAYRGG
jgi:hypothetical protein